MCQEQSTRPFTMNPSSIPPIHEDQYFRLRTISELEDLNRAMRQVKSDIVNMHNLLAHNPVEPPTSGLTFGEALLWLKGGTHVTRKAWHNRNIVVWLWQPDNLDLMRELRVKTVNGQGAPWNPNHQELLADDWEVVE